MRESRESLGTLDVKLLLSLLYLSGRAEALPFSLLEESEFCCPLGCVELDATEFVVVILCAGFCHAGV